MDTIKSREAAFKIAYEIEARKSDIASQEILKLNLEESPFGDKAKNYISWLINGVIEKSDEYDETIKKCLKNWTLKRISKVSLAAIKLAIFEIEESNEIVPAIAISQAVSLADKFDGQETSSFVNGVLGQYMKQKG